MVAVQEVTPMAERRDLVHGTVTSNAVAKTHHYRVEN